MKSIRTGILVPLVLSVLLTPVLAGDLIREIGKNKWTVSKPGDKGAREPTSADFDASIITVTAEDYDAVTYTLRVGGKTTRQKLSSTKVDVIFYEPHQGYAKAAQAMEGGRYDEAISLFESLAKNKGNRFWVRMYSLANMAEIYGAMGQWQDVVKTYGRLIKTFPKTRYIDKAYVEIGKAHLMLGNPAAAETSFRKLERVPGLPEGKKKLAKYYQIFIKESAGQIAAALSAYKRLLAEVEKSPDLAEVAILSRLGVGRCLVLSKKFDEALTFFHEIVDSSDEPGVLAGAFNGLGQCYFEQNKWKDALTAFLRTVVLYEENPEHTAMALYHAGRSFHFLATGDVEGYKDRARGLFRECIQRFPSSSWAAKSKSALLEVRGK